MNVAPKAGFLPANGVQGWLQRATQNLRSRGLIFLFLVAIAPTGGTRTLQIWLREQVKAAL
jgi:hypothetical protein